jgi:hypothetical protein
VVPDGALCGPDYGLQKTVWGRRQWLVASDSWLEQFGVGLDLNVGFE